MLNPSLEFSFDFSIEFCTERLSLSHSINYHGEANDTEVREALFEAG